MFEEGKTYNITMLEDDAVTHEGTVEATYFNCTVTEVQWPLVRCAHGEIINLTSPRFVKAVLRD